MQNKELGSLIEEEMGALEALREMLISSPVLTVQKSNGQYNLDTDDCDRQEGYVLLQRKDYRDTKAIGYWSRTLTDQEKNLDTTHYKYIAVVGAALLLHPYLEGC